MKFLGMHLTRDFIGEQDLSGIRAIMGHNFWSKKQSL